MKHEAEQFTLPGMPKTPKRPNTYTLQVGPKTTELLAELHESLSKQLPGVALTMTAVLQLALRSGLSNCKMEYKLKNTLPESILK